MTEAFDDRLMKLKVEFDGKTIEYDQGYYIAAYGTKFTNGTLGECVLRLDNIDKQTRDLLVTKTSPWVIPRKYVNITLSVGRKSYGTFALFEGQAQACNPTQPPDIGLIFKSFASSFLLGNIGTLTAPPFSSLEKICQQIAEANGLTLDYQAGDRTIGNFSYTGALALLIKKINELGGVWAYQDGKTLVVTKSNRARSSRAIEINAKTGMIGIPSVNETGVSVKMLITNELRVGDLVNVKSEINPAANGDYIVYKLSYEVASRDTPFYWHMFLRPANYALGFISDR